MNKNAQWSGIKWILLGMIILIGIIFAFGPPIKKLLSADIGAKIRCEESGMTLTESQEYITFLLEEFDVSASSDEDEKAIVEVYKEFADCFPDNDFDSYMENIREQDTFSFIFVMKEQKHYDKITLKIAQRYLIRFSASSRVSDVQSYVNEAKASS